MWVTIHDTGDCTQSIDIRITGNARDDIEFYGNGTDRLIIVREDLNSGFWKAVLESNPHSEPTWGRLSPKRLIL